MSMCIPLGLQIGGDGVVVSTSASKLISFSKRKENRERRSYPRVCYLLIAR
jgi:hypothetical protein